MKKIIAANIISGLSLMCLIVFGVTYIQFKNTPIYENYSIEIINNPVSQGEDIKFVMVGTKVLSCTAKNVYGLAYNDEQGTVVKLDRFTQMYIHNTPIGEDITNRWAFAMPAELAPGNWRVDMVADWECRFWMFKEKTTRTFGNILLIVN